VSEDPKNLMNNSHARKSGVGHRLLSNTVLNFVGQAFILVLTFATAPYIVHHLGAEFFGIIALVQTVAGFAGFLNLGIGRALTKYVSELSWKQEWGQINELFRTAWATCIFAGAFGLLILVGPQEKIGGLFFRGGPEVSPVIGYALYVAAFGLFTSMLLEVIAAMPGALQRFDIVNSVNVLMGVVRSLGAVILLKMGYGVRAVLLINLLSNFIGVVAFAVASRKLIPTLNLVPSFHWHAFRRLFSFSLPLFISAISGLIVTRVDRFILAYYMPLAAVTFYTLPYSLSEKLSMGVSNISSVVYPFASELHSRDEHGRLQELYVRASKLLTLVTLPLMTLLLAIPGPILRYWLGPEYATEGAVCLSLLGVASFLGAMSAVSTVTALGAGRAWMPASFAVGSSIINLVSNLLLIPRYGINGAALGQLLPQAIVVPVFLLVTIRTLKFSVGKVLVEGLLRPLLCATVQFVFLILLGGFVKNTLEVMLLASTSLVLFGILALLVAASAAERDALLSHLTSHPALAWLVFLKSQNQTT
jgi:O-antigen/teichoic acid export membrane protein